jgi:hypothetical protein
MESQGPPSVAICIHTFVRSSTVKFTLEILLGGAVFCLQN